MTKRKTTPEPVSQPQSQPVPPQRVYKFFKLSEFDSRDLKGSGERMNHETILRLDKARELAGIPFVIESGFRTEARNKAVGGAKNSAHLRGFAVDVRAATRDQFQRIVLAGIAAGFRRIGAMTSTIHFDDDPSLPETQWLYDSGNLEQRERLAFIRAALAAWDFYQSIK